MGIRQPQVLVAALLLGLGSSAAKGQGQDFFNGEALTSLQRYRAYPHVDRGLREYDRKRYRAAAESFAKALEIAPASVRVRVSLARAYVAEGRFEEAERELRPLAGKDTEAAAALFHLRAGRLDGGLSVSRDTLLGWLRDCPSAWCGRYAALAVTYLANHGQATAAREILADYRARGLAGEPRATLVLEAAVAESLKDWDGARNAWQAAAGIRPLSAAENYRYGMALLESGDFNAVHALLEGGLGSSPEGQRLAREYIQKAIAAKRPQAAREQLARLDAAGGLGPRERAQWLRLLLAAGQRTDAERLLAEMDRARCPAPNQGGECSGALPAGMGEREWLAAAAQLGRIDIVERVQPDSEAGKRQRLHLLADHYRKHGQYSLLISLVPPSPPDRRLALALALAYQRTGAKLAAATQLESSFYQWRRWSDLDQASYLMVTGGAPERARHLLEATQPFPKGKQGAALLQRLLDIYQAAPEQADTGRLEALERQNLSPAQRDVLADLWRRRGRCDRSIALLEKGRPGMEGLLLLADCHRSSRPDLAARYLERALPYAPELATRSLAYLHAEAGNPTAAVARWKSLPPRTLDRRDRLVAAAAAIEAGDLASARNWWLEAQSPEDAEWHRLGGHLEDKAGNSQEALEHWAQALRLEPDGASAYAMGRLQAALGRPEEALASYREAFRLAPDEDEYRLSLAFALMEKEPSAAAALMDGSRRQGAKRFPVDEQLGYLHIRLGDNEAARRHLVAALDTADDYLAQLPDDEAADRRFALRRSREGLDRRWSFGLSTWAASNGVPGELLAGRPLPTGSPRHYTEVNGEMRLGQQPMDNYRFLALTARASVQGTERDPYLQGRGLFGVGLRWKPFSDWNLYLSAEEQFPLGGGKSDFMVRASASLLDRGAYRGDWHAGGRGWFQQDLYLDGAQWLDSGRYDVLARYTFGYNRKLETSAASTVFPYAFAQSEKRSDGNDSRWGLGVAFRLWRDEDRYNAYRQSFNIKVERQQVIHSDLARSNGWFIKLEGNW